MPFHLILGDETNLFPTFASFGLDRNISVPTALEQKLGQLPLILTDEKLEERVEPHWSLARPSQPAGPERPQQSTREAQG